MQVRVALTAGPELPFASVSPSRPAAPHGSVAGPRVEVDTGLRFQQIAGFGGSFTDSSAFLIDRELDAAERERAMTLLFDPRSGIGLSLLRNPMGASDYARDVYTYDDVPEGESDPQLSRFSIDHDRESIVPLTRWAKRLNPDLQVFASPWSAPGWMKDSGSAVTGALLPRWYPAYADYFVRFIEAYRDEGLPIAAVTPQNEPLFVPSRYPGMSMPAEAQLEFVRDHLRPALRRAGLATRVFGYDHNWDHPDYPLHLLTHSPESFDGIAWHWYGGSPAAQEVVSRAHPGKEVHVTEAAGGEWIPEFAPAFSNLLRTGIDILRHGSQSLILWNLALDLENGPVVAGFGRSTCRGLLRVDREAGSFEPTPDWTGLAHFSKYIRPGASRVASTEPAPIRSLAAVNVDGALAVVLFNDSDSDADCVVGVDGELDQAVALPAGAAATLSFATTDHPIEPERTDP